jgi:hypothetical protein
MPVDGEHLPPAEPPDTAPDVVGHPSVPRELRIIIDGIVIVGGPVKEKDGAGEAGQPAY